MFKKLLFAVLLLACGVGAMAKDIQPVTVDQPAVVFWDEWLDNDWALESRSLYSYDQGRMSEILNQLYVDATTWLNESKQVFAYDSQGQLLSVSNYYWQMSGELWWGDFRVVSEFNNGRKLCSTTQMYDGTAWVDVSKTTFEYNGQGQCDLECTDMWMGTDWTAMTESHHTYNGNGQLAETLNKSFSYVSSQMENSGKSTYSYNSHGDKVEVVSEVCMSGYWENTVRQSYTYNNDYQVTEHLTEQWLYQAWDNLKRVVNSYSGGKLSETVMQDWEDAAWVNQDRLRYDYSGSTAVSEYAALPELYSLGNYPNPFNPETQIVYALPTAAVVGLTVYDIRGREVVRLVDLEARGAGSHEVRWDGCNAMGRTLPSGVYVYRLRVAGKVITRRCLLLK